MLERIRSYGFIFHSPFHISETAYETFIIIAFLDFPLTSLFLGSSRNNTKDYLNMINAPLS